MSSTLITTKLHMPQVRKGRVSRPRLTAKLQQGLPQKLILICAPAGYGKTTLLCEWLEACGETSAWVTLDKADNDPERFWAYVITAIQGALSSMGDSLPDQLLGHNSEADEAQLTELLNQLEKLRQNLILVLDDYHFIESPSIHDGVTFLLEYAPARFHIVLGTRADPPLPLAKLRARSELLELRQADLSFTDREASDFLAHTMGLQISPEFVAQITDRTEGWIAGLQMAALSLQNTDDAAGFISALTGNHRYIFDYLLEEILKRQRPEIRRFLLFTSILDQFTAPLCDALLQPDEDSQAATSIRVLEEIERANLFISPVDDEHSWYRYHSLFADLLRGYLRRDHADQVPSLHNRASVWFEEQGLIPDAIHHAMTGGEWERVVQLLSTNVFALLEQSELSAVSRQLENLTSGMDDARPWLWIGCAWLAAYTGRLDSLESILDKAEAEVSGTSNQDEQRTLRGHSAAIRAYAAWIAGKRDDAVRAAQEALERLNPADRMIRCQSATLLGLSLESLSDRARAFEQALAYARECKTCHVTVFAYGCWAYLLMLQGRLHEAHAVCVDAVRMAHAADSRQPFPSLSTVYSTLSQILWEWNDLEGALRFGRKAVDLARRWEQADALHFAYTNLGEALFASGDVQGAFNILNDAWQLAQRTSVWFEEITVAQEVEWLLAQRNSEAALRRLDLAREGIEETSRKFIAPTRFMTRAQVFLAQKQYARALNAIALLLSDLQKKGNVYHSMKALIWQARIYDAMGKRTQALDSLQKACDLAAPAGCIRSFYPLGGESLDLLRGARAEGIRPDFVDSLLEIFERPQKAIEPEPAAGSRLIEPLSRREMEVLQLLAQGCSDKEIAERLVIARETVHKHLKNIYGKLDAHSRAQAVIQARELGLL